MKDHEIINKLNQFENLSKLKSTNHFISKEITQYHAKTRKFKNIFYFSTLFSIFSVLWIYMLESSTTFYSYFYSDFYFDFYFIPLLIVIPSFTMVCILGFLDELRTHFRGCLSKVDFLLYFSFVLLFFILILNVASLSTSFFYWVVFFNILIAATIFLLQYTLEKKLIKNVYRQKKSLELTIDTNTNIDTNIDANIDNQLIKIKEELKQELTDVNIIEYCEYLNKDNKGNYANKLILDIRYEFLRDNGYDGILDYKKSFITEGCILIE